MAHAHQGQRAQQRVVVLVGAADWQDARRAADAYSAVLASRKDIFEATPIGEQTQSDWLSLFQRHRLVLLTAAIHAFVGSVWGWAAIDSDKQPEPGADLENTLAALLRTFIAGLQ
mgnify:CR=1 FL=1